MGKDPRILFLFFARAFCASVVREHQHLDSADFLGKKRVIKKAWGYSGGRMSRNYSKQEEHKIRPSHRIGE